MDLEVPRSSRGGGTTLPRRDSPTDVVLVGDVGGTTVRAALIDDTGAAVAIHAAPSPSVDGRGPVAEIEPDGWWEALRDGAAALARTAPGSFERVCGIAICGVTRTQVLVRPDGRPTRPAIAWRDARAADEAESWAATLPADHPERSGLDAFHPLARLAWLGRHEPDTLRDATVLDPKDFLNARLTGRTVSDVVSMARLAAAARPGPGAKSLIWAAGLPENLVPELVAPTAEVARVRAGLPAPLDRLAGVPVFCASHDTWAAVAGLGAMRPGLAYNISGTTEVFGLVLEREAQAHGLLCVDWCGVHQLGGPSQTGADTAAWLLGCLGREVGDGDVGQALDALLAAPRHPQPLLFLPHLQGERVPYWDPALRGAFVGLSREHGPGDLAWAVLEGIAFLNREVLARAEGASGMRAQEIRLGGGAARNPAWCQVKADVCDRPVCVGEAAEPGLLGAALVAWTGLGRFADLDDAQRRLVRVAHRYEPRPPAVATYRRLAELHARTGEALAPISRGLARLPDDLPNDLLMAPLPATVGAADGDR